MQTRHPLSPFAASTVSRAMQIEAARTLGPLELEHDASAPAPDPPDGAARSSSTQPKTEGGTPMRSIPRRLLRRHSTAVAYLPLFAALGGSAYAAVTVTGKNIKDGTITGRDVKNRSLGTNKLSTSAVSSLTGQRGPAGPRERRANTARSAPPARSAPRVRAGPRARRVRPDRLARAGSAAANTEFLRQGRISGRAAWAMRRWTAPAARRPSAAARAPLTTARTSRQARPPTVGLVGGFPTATRLRRGHDLRLGDLREGRLVGPPARRGRRHNWPGLCAGPTPRSRSSPYGIPPHLHPDLGRGADVARAAREQGSSNTPWTEEVSK